MKNEEGRVKNEELRINAPSSSPGGSYPLIADLIRDLRRFRLKGRNEVRKPEVVC